MAVFSESSVQLVKEAADIVEVIGEYVQLRKKGTNYQGLCPFHSEKTPSFSVNPTRQFYHCFGCKESGDVFSFFMKYNNLGFQESLEALADRYGITLSRNDLTREEKERLQQKDSLFRINSEAARLYHDFLVNSPAAAQAREYLEKRGLSSATIAGYQLGYAPPRWDFFKKSLSSLNLSLETAVNAGLIARNDRGRTYDRFRDRIMFPIFAMDGRVAGFGGRVTGDGEPKYLNSPETEVFSKSRLLYGLYQNSDAVRKAGRCLVVEGNFDLLGLAEQGLDYVAAPLGTALTRSHVQAVKRYAGEAVLLFDGDEAGRKAAMNSIPLFLAERMPARVVSLTGDEDPDTFIKRAGKEELEKRIDNASSLPEFVFDSLVDQYGLSLEGKNRIIEELAPMVKAIDNNELQQSLFISHFSGKLAISPAEMEDKLFKGSRPQPPPAKGKDLDSQLPVQERQLLEFLLVYPDVLPRMLEAGMTRVCRHRIFLDIVGKMEESGFESTGSPELLLDVLEGQARSLISALLMTAPTYPEGSKEVMVQEMAQWLQSKIRQQRKSELITRISEAQQKGDDDLLFHLLEEKKKIDENGAGITAS